MKKKILLTWIVSFVVLINAAGQIQPGKLQEFIGQSVFNNCNLQLPKAVKEFYLLNGYSCVWLNGSAKNISLLDAYIASASSLGLDKEDYQPALFKKIQTSIFSQVNEYDSLTTEVKLTDAAIHFFRDVLMGNKPVSISYNGLDYHPSCFNVTQLLWVYLSANRFDKMLDDTEHKEPAYVTVKNKLNLFLDKMRNDDIEDIVIKSNKVSNANKELKKRLCQLDFIESDTITFSETVLKSKLKEAQKLFGLLNDGILRSTTIAALNVPLRYRVDELSNTLNTVRWLSCMKQTATIIVVNIPSANLLLYEQGRVVLESRIVVGKPSTTTPTLCSKVTEVILYPYWNVPYKIATTELLPIIKRNRGYLNANGFQVLNGAGKVIDPASVNWRSLSAAYFPYTIRQSTGCDNSLGLIKLNFYNPFSVYLHDTPYKALFMSYRRYYSHGCMRLERAMDVGHYLLKGNEIAIDTLEEKGCLRNQQPIIVPVKEALPVFVLYNTAWFDSSACITFYEDIYDKLNRIRK